MSAKEHSTGKQERRPLRTISVILILMLLTPALLLMSGCEERATSSQQEKWGNGNVVKETTDFVKRKTGFAVSCPWCGTDVNIPKKAFRSASAHMPDGIVGGVIKKVEEISKTCPKCKWSFHVIYRKQ